ELAHPARRFLRAHRAAGGRGAVQRASLFHDQSEPLRARPVAGRQQSAALFQASAREGRVTHLANSENAPGRLVDRQPIAIIDIGSNSVRLVVHEGASRSPTPIFNEKVLAGLGRTVASTGMLDPDAMVRALAALRRYRKLAEQLGATR